MSLFIKTSLLLMMADLFILSGFILSGEAGVFLLLQQYVQHLISLY